MFSVPLTLSHTQTCSVQYALEAKVKSELVVFWVGGGGRMSSSCLLEQFAEAGHGGELHRTICAFSALNYVLEVIKDANWMYILT